MPNVAVSKEAQRDIAAIRQYIHDELSNPDAAQRIVSALKKSILSLAAFPGRGRSLDTLVSVHTEYRYLVCENYCIFYLNSDEENVIVIRVLHLRQDCLKALFMS